MSVNSVIFYPFLPVIGARFAPSPASEVLNYVCSVLRSDATVHWTSTDSTLYSFLPVVGALCTPLRIKHTRFNSVGSLISSVYAFEIFHPVRPFIHAVCCPSLPHLSFHSSVPTPCATQELPISTVTVFEATTTTGIIATETNP